MDRLGTQKSGSRSMEICLSYKSLNLEQIRSLSAQFSNGRFEGTVLLSASCDEGKSFHQAPRNESKASGRKVADSELNSPASRMNENRLLNAVKRTAHFSPLLTSTSAGGTDPGLSGVQSNLTKGKVKGIIDRRGNIKNATMRRARCGMWGWIFALVFFWNTHMLRAQGKFEVQHHETMFGCLFSKFEHYFNKWYFNTFLASTGLKNRIDTI